MDIPPAPTILRIFAAGTAKPTSASNCVGMLGLLVITLTCPACEIATSHPDQIS